MLLSALVRFGFFFRFKREDRGSLTIFSLFIIVIMLIAGGMAVDFMRQETARAQLQSTLDRAILAAADMDQQIDATELVQDYFAKSGLHGYQLTVTPTDSYSSRRVSAVVTQKVDSFFLHFLGIDHLDAPAVGAAEEGITSIEISLVLDVSGSMGERSASGKTKIEDLRKAAKQFVATIYGQTDPTRTSISIVPYSTQVNAGAALLNQFNYTHDHDYSYCVDFTGTDFTRTYIDTATLLDQAGHIDPTTNRNTRTPQFRVCNPAEYAKVLPVTNDIDRLNAKIDSLLAGGNTSIEIGVKWGAALLEPEARPAIAALTADDTDASQKVPAVFADRPLDKNDQVLKVVVVMTDGINTQQWVLADDYKRGASHMWKDPSSGTYSIKSGTRYYVPSSNTWRTTPYGGNNAVQLSFPQLFDEIAMPYHAYNMMYKMTGDSQDYYAWLGGWTDSRGVYHAGAYSTVSASEKDTRLDAICTKAKADDIRIYAIGFEVTDYSASVMQKCASSPSHFFRVNGLSIADAFAAIANDIGKLRLTQ